MADLERQHGDFTTPAGSAEGQTLSRRQFWPRVAGELLGLDQAIYQTARIAGRTLAAGLVTAEAASMEGCGGPPGLPEGTPPPRDQRFVIVPMIQAGEQPPYGLDDPDFVTAPLATLNKYMATWSYGHVDYSHHAIVTNKHYQTRDGWFEIPATTVLSQTDIYTIPSIGDKIIMTSGIPIKQYPNIVYLAKFEGPGVAYALGGQRTGGNSRVFERPGNGVDPLLLAHEFLHGIDPYEHSPTHDDLVVVRHTFPIDTRNDIPQVGRSILGDTTPILDVCKRIEFGWMPENLVETIDVGTEVVMTITDIDDLAVKGPKAARVLVPLPTGVTQTIYLQFNRVSDPTGYGPSSEEGLQARIWDETITSNTRQICTDRKKTQLKQGTSLELTDVGFSVTVRSYSSDGKKVDVHIVNKPPQ